MELQRIKQRYGIIGNSPLLNRAIEVAVQIAPTEITTIIYGESGVGKENFSGIIHQLSVRKHGPYIAVNCGAIPEGTIDSELFGHEKGAFTGAHDTRKGYFEVVNGGTIFLDEVAELPLSTQSRLLRVLELGEYIRVGSSKVMKTNVRVIAATHVNLIEEIKKGKFREDLYYRLSTVPIKIPPLRDRKEDIHLLFRKFASDAASKYKMPTAQLDKEAQELLTNYRWPGNIRQLKNVAEQVAILEEQRLLDKETLSKYLPKDEGNSLPVLFQGGNKESDVSERELLYRVLFDMKKDIIEIKKVIVDLVQNSNSGFEMDEKNARIISRFHEDDTLVHLEHKEKSMDLKPTRSPENDFEITEPKEEVEEWAKKDSIDRLEKYMRRKNLLDDKYKENILTKSKDIVEKAVTEFEKLPAPDPKDIFKYVFAEMTPQQKEEMEELFGNQ